MLLRWLTPLLLLLSLAPARGQQALTNNLTADGVATGDISVPSAWVDLRQMSTSRPQAAPGWVESVTLTPPSRQPGVAPKSTFRIRLQRPLGDYRVLLFRLFFEDQAEAEPEIIVWDESGSQILRSGSLGEGLEMPTSQTVVIPMANVSTIDVEVAGDGKSVRGAYLDWMTSSETIHPVNAPHRDVIPEPFAASAPLHAPESDVAQFGTVTATLAPEAIRIGPNVSHGASFQFGIESTPLMALLTFEVLGAKMESPPVVYLNGANLGPVNLAMPDLADPGYRGEMASLVKQMQFTYTGWLRAQMLVPIARLKAGANDMIVVAGPGTPVSAIRATQMQLKYLWDKSDYILQPER